MVGETERVDGPDGGKVERGAHSPVGQKLHEEGLAVALVRSSLAAAVAQRQVDQDRSQQLPQQRAPPHLHFR